MNGHDDRERIFIYQIYYDLESKRKLDSGFISLDNSENSRPDWFEFWPIFQFLKNNELDDEAWYGFFSPRFLEKTGIKSDTVINIIKEHATNCDVVLFSYAWDQLSYFLNPFEQGEVWHPGISSLTQKFFDGIGLPINLNEMVTYSSTSVFSNYLVAKPSFWRRWLSLANLFFDAVENHLIPDVNTDYVTPQNKTPMKTFIQERFASVVLYQGGLKVLLLDRSNTDPVFDLLFYNDSSTRKMLQICDFMKSKYVETQDKSYLDMYYKIRNGIQLKVA